MAHPQFHVIIGVIDCSAYVSWVLFQYGYKDFGGEQHVADRSSIGVAIMQHQNDGWKEILNATAGQLEPGDIYLFDGQHTGIFVKKDGGSFYGFDCGATEHWTTGLKTIDGKKMTEVWLEESFIIYRPPPDKK